MVLIGEPVPYGDGQPGIDALVRPGEPRADCGNGSEAVSRSSAPFSCAVRRRQSRASASCGAVKAGTPGRMACDLSEADVRQGRAEDFFVVHAYGREADGLYRHGRCGVVVAAKPRFHDDEIHSRFGEGEQARGP